jgi:hypothetical protein
VNALHERPLTFLKNLAESEEVTIRAKRRHRTCRIILYFEYKSNGDIVQSMHDCDRATNIVSF